MGIENKDNRILINYMPDKGIRIDGINLKWGTEREIVRQLLNNQHKADDSVTDLSEYFNGDKTRIIYRRRDVYKEYLNFDNYFFLNYDSNCELRDIEIHHGCNIKIRNINLSFSENIKSVLESIRSLSENVQKTGSDEYYFKDLKLTIADQEHMGGDGHKLAYFYCSKNTNHLGKK